MTKQLVKSKKLVGLGPAKRRREKSIGLTTIRQDRSARWYHGGVEAYRNMSDGKMYVWNEHTDRYEQLSKYALPHITVRPFKTLNERLKNHESWKVSDTWESSVHWDETAPWTHRELREMTIENKFGTRASIIFKEEEDFIEVFSMDVWPKGTGFGSHIMRRITDYADKSHKSVVLTKVQNEKFAESVGFERRDPDIDGEPLSEITGFAEYIWGDVPTDAVDYSWVTKEE